MSDAVDPDITPEEAAESEAMAQTHRQTVFRIRDFVDPVTIRKDLAYSDNNLSDAMMQQASLFAHYGQLSAEALRQLEIAKLLLDQTEAAVYQQLRKDLLKAGEKVTEAMLEKLVSRSKRVIAMKQAVIEARRVESVAKTAMEAFRHRRDMLVQKGLISREEMKGEMRIMEKTVREEAAGLQRTDALQRIQDAAARRKEGVES